MAKKYVLIKNTKEKLEVVSKNEHSTYIKNSKGQEYMVPNNYLITLEEFNLLKMMKKLKL